MLLNTAKPITVCDISKTTIEQCDMKNVQHEKMSGMKNGTILCLSKRFL